MGLGCDESENLIRRGPELAVEIDTIDFGVVPLGATKRVAVELANVGDQALSIREVATPAPFFVELSVLEIPPGGTARLDVAFTPERIDLATGAVSLDTDGAQSPVRISLRGSAEQAVLRAVPSELSFGSVRLQESSVREIVLTSNAVPVEGQILTETFIREEHWDVTFVSRFGEPASFSLASLDQQVLTLEYRPFTTGPDPGRILFEFCGDRCGVWVDVDATAVDSRMRIEPPVLDFGAVGIGRSSTRQVVVRSVADEPFSVSDVRLRGSDEVAVEPDRPLPFELGAGDSVALRVTYEPFAARELEAEMVVETDDPTIGARDVAIFGRGAGPRFEVFPELVAFGQVDERATRRTLLLVNSGSSDVRVIRLGLEGDPQIRLVEPPPVPLRLGAGDSSLVTLELNPSRTGTYTATVTVTTDDPELARVEVPARAFRGDRLCQLRAIPTSLNFGILQPGLAREKPVRLENIGNDECLIEGVELRAPGDPFFSVVPDPWPEALAPGETLQVGVRFAPTEERAAKAALVVSTNDPIAPRQTINLLGSGLFYINVFVEPESIDLGALRPNCNVSSETLRLINAGDRAVEVEAVDIEPAVANVTRSGPLPVRVDGGQSAGWTVAWRPEAPGQFTADAIVDFADLPFPIRVPVRGEASFDARSTDAFEQRDIADVDVLFVIDNSCSMLDDQQALARNASTFIREADLRGSRYRIGVTTTSDWPDQGRLVGPVIDRDALDPSEVISLFRQQAQVGTSGSGIEEGAASALAALRKAQLGNELNRDLLRDDASVVLIIVTDEDDSSPGNMAAYYRDISRIVPNDLVVAVVSGGTSGCGTALPTPRYQSFLGLTGGEHVSICDDWGANLEELGETAFAPATSFELRAVQEPSLPVEVTIDGQPVPSSEWSLTPDAPTLNFATPPPPRSRIVVSYVPRCE